MGSRHHRKARDATLSGFGLQDHGQFIGVEQAGKPLVAIAILPRPAREIA
jgi:hypothetical protein